MCFINENKIEAADREITMLRIDEINHSLIRAQCDAGVQAPRVGIIRNGGYRFAREELYEILLGLIDQSSPVSEEKNILDPTVTHKNFG